MFKLILLVDNANDSGDNDKDNKKIKVIVAESHRKTMIRTLLNLSDNKEFSNKYRKVENQIRIKHMNEFIINHFHSKLTIDQHSFIMDTAPCYHEHTVMQ